MNDYQPITHKPLPVGTRVKWCGQLGTITPRDPASSYHPWVQWDDGTGCYIAECFLTCLEPDSVGLHERFNEYVQVSLTNGAKIAELIINPTGHTERYGRPASIKMVLQSACKIERFPDGFSESQVIECSADSSGVGRYSVTYLIFFY